MIHIPYKDRFGHLPDFEVTYDIFPSEEGGRQTAAFKGIRWDFTYKEHPDERFII